MMRWLLAMVALTGVAFASSLYVYYFERERLPAQVPVHWDINFHPDHFVPRDEVLPYLLLLPGLMAVMLLLTPLLPWLSPRNFEVDRPRRVYLFVMGLMVILFAYLHGTMLWTMVQGGTWPGRLFVAGIFLFFALLGSVLGQVQRNFWMGVRTPWTLASEAVWVRTHQLTGGLFMAVGAAGFVAVLAGAPLLWCFAGFMVAALVPIPYSLVLYKRLEKQGRV
jgi:uncharacterized membrane protein